MEHDLQNVKLAGCLHFFIFCRINIVILPTKSVCGSMNRASACGAKDLWFNSYWAQVSVG